MKEQTYIRFPKPESKDLRNRPTDPGDYAKATWRNTTPIGGMICIGFSTGHNITSLVKLDIENARLLEESLREYIKTDTETMEKAAASTGF